MRQSLLLSLLIALTCFSCKKNNSVNPIDPALSGQWKMVSVKDNSTNTIITKPSFMYLDINIEIVFTAPAKGRLSGSLTQESVNGDFTIGRSNVISIPLIKMNSYFDAIGGSADWDKEFCNNITLCQTYFFDSGGNLNINISNNKILTFTR